MEAKIKNITVTVKNGNLAIEPADCIVVPEFDSCASYGGVGAAIEYAGMSAGLEAYDKAVRNKPLAYGDVLITESGKAGVKLAHAATAGADADIQFEVVFKAVFQILAEASKLGLKSVALPEIGTGIIGNLTQSQSARALACAVAKFADLYPTATVEHVILVIYRGATAPAEKVLSEGSYAEFRNEAGQKKFSMAEWLQGMGFLG